MLIQAVFLIANDEPHRGHLFQCLSMKNKRPGPTVIQRVATLVNDEEILQQILLKDGIAISQASISRIAKRVKERGSALRQPGSGRPRATNDRTDRALVSLTHRDPKISRAELQRLTGVSLFADTHQQPPVHKAQERVYQR